MSDDKLIRIKNGLTVHFEFEPNLPADAALILQGENEIYLHRGKIYIPHEGKWLALHVRDLMEIIPNYRSNSLNLEFNDYTLHVHTEKQGNIAILRDLFQLVQSWKWEVA